MLAPNKDYVDLSKPSIEGLVYALRHREVWPEGFSWNFPDCSRCAIGLAGRLWDLMGSESISKAIGLSEEQRRDIFFGPDPKRCNGWTDNTSPEFVAAKLEKISTQNRRRVSNAR